MPGKTPKNNTMSRWHVKTVKSRAPANWVKLWHLTQAILYHDAGQHRRCMAVGVAANIAKLFLEFPDATAGI